MSSSKITTDHKVIRSWIEERKGVPSVVAGTENNQEGSGLLRISFSDDNRNNLRKTDWDTFFKTFEEKKLAFLYQDETKEHKESRFFKFISRDS
ncbi:MAG: hypothetical protein AB2L20_21045 [Mangrovibacterium sp.]|jgi:hypothetical protein